MTVFRGEFVTCCTWKWLQDRQSPVAVLKSESCGSALKILPIHVVSFRNLSFIGKEKKSLEEKATECELFCSAMEMCEQVF